MANPARLSYDRAMRIALAADHAGFALKNDLADFTGVDGQFTPVTFDFGTQNRTVPGTRK